ncbi:MAG: hypothetical protein KF770_02450 [Anaerolineae bacterium]|nr:hypothetical protein [Anaerolineae bacterium]
MTAQKTPQTCFNCSRTDEVIPLVVWSYRERPLPVCSACMPLLIHKWEQVTAQLDARFMGENDE